MDKISLVEHSHKNELVIYDEGSDTIYVCFGSVKKLDEHTLKFFDCSIADIEDGQEEYYGEVFNEAYNLTFKLPETIKDLFFIPTRFVDGELIKRTKRRNKQ